LPERKDVGSGREFSGDSRDPAENKYMYDELARCEVVYTPYDEPTYEMSRS
jgi:hypothetical protein